jgi:hypothetical protein
MIHAIVVWAVANGRFAELQTLVQRDRPNLFSATE